MEEGSLFGVLDVSNKLHQAMEEGSLFGVLDV